MAKGRKRPARKKGSSPKPRPPQRTGLVRCPRCGIDHDGRTTSPGVANAVCATCSPGITQPVPPDAPDQETQP